MLKCTSADRRSATGNRIFARVTDWMLTLVLGCALAGAAAETVPAEAPTAPRDQPGAAAPKEKAMHKPLPTPAEIAQLPADGGAEFNRLIFEKSPYLLQHARNPVDWYPWGPAAFEKAKKENKPIFLSVGYSTCHWCHVMERESFESEAIAKILNERYVAIKVDREERPDLDDIYMNATQLMTQRGGWPNSLWLRPDATPWFAGTYFPPDDRYGRPGFSSVLTKLSEVWQQQREKVDEQAEMLANEMKRLGGGALVEAEQPLSRSVVAAALEKLPKTFDRFKGGFGAAPKFPPHGSLALMLYELQRPAVAEGLDRDTLLDMTRRTLDTMNFGGIHDHIGGGFHRYSTDADWFLPHFEKMLYDNAQLAAVYTQAYALTRDPAYAAVARDICDWVLRDMTDPAGGFYSALDADSEGEEGKFYLWTPAEVAVVLGETDAALFCRVYNVEKDGNYREEATGHASGASIAHLKRSLADSAKIESEPLDAFTARLAAMREKLRVARDRRVHPHLDDKVLTSWNGLMIGALAQAGTTLEEPRYLAAAEKAAGFLLTRMYKNGRLLRTARAGEAKLDGYLEDYAFLGNGLLDLGAATGKSEYRDRARELAAEMVKHFYDAEAGGFYFTANDHEKLLLRQKDAFDQAIPSGNGMAVQLLARLSVLPDTPAAGASRQRTQARASLNAFLGLMEKMPRGTESLLLGVARFFDTAPTGAEPAAADAPAAAADQPDAQARAGEVAAAAYLSALQAAPGGVVRIAVRLTVAEGYHIYDLKEQDAPVLPTAVKLAEATLVPPPAGSPPKTKPTKVRIQQPVTITATDAPAAKEETLAGDKVKVYAGTIVVLLTCKLNADLKPGKETIVLQVIAQPCSDKVCKEPVDLRLMLPIEIVKDAPLQTAPRHADQFQR